MAVQFKTLVTTPAGGHASSEPRRSSLRQMLAEMRETLRALDRAGAAAHRYEELSQLSDEELARFGMKRSDLARKVFDEMGSPARAPAVGSGAPFIP
ncbi:MAG TPA: hypothetical protein VNK52_14730 [Hyphomicrobiaceae bacterium]|nr:hypothetical protein [Hyphomicrobiaceae bacterium]